MVAPQLVAAQDFARITALAAEAVTFAAAARPAPATVPAVPTTGEPTDHA
jgi:hypothetical protein